MTWHRPLPPVCTISKQLAPLFVSSPRKLETPNRTRNKQLNQNNWTTFIMMRMGMATQETTGGTSPAKRHDVAPPTWFKSKFRFKFIYLSTEIFSIPTTMNVTQCSAKISAYMIAWPFGELTYQISNSNAKTKCQASGVQKSSPGWKIFLKLSFA